MSYRSLLVPLDADSLCDSRTAVAIRLARSFDAHLTGLAPTGQVEMPASPAGAVAFADLAAQTRSRLHEQAQDAARRFRQACAEAALADAEAVVEEASITGSLLRHALGSDLIVLSQPDPRSVFHRATREAIERLVLGSGRPCLLLPYAGRVERIGTRVLLAWDGSREAARAAADALPLLRVARQVIALQWREAKAAADPQADAHAPTLQAWLGRHGVQVEWRAEGTEIGIADAMLSRAADLGADLIVMGGYGHARWTEWLLGGATRGLLDAMTVPVLMSH